MSSEIKEIQGKDTSLHVFLVCGNDKCSEFFGCKNVNGVFRACTMCGFHQKMCCAQTLDIIRDERRMHQIQVWADSCEFCPPNETNDSEPIAFMSS